MTKTDFTEWFGSKSAALAAAARLERKGYRASVRYAMRANCSHDWLVEAWGQ